MDNINYEVLIEDIKLCYEFKYNDDDSIFERLVELEEINSEKDEIDDHLYRMRAEINALQERLELAENLLLEHDVKLPYELPF